MAIKDQKRILTYINKWKLPSLINKAKFKCNEITYISFTAYNWASSCDMLQTGNLLVKAIE